jgi:histidinol-phosphate phosphatase family protein
MNKKLLSVLEEHDVKVEKIYTCSHAIKENCDCRKPKIGLIEQATKDFQIDRRKSWIIGDRISDIQLAEAVEMKSIFVQSELHKIGDSNPNFIAVNLCKAVEYITKNL